MRVSAAEAALGRGEPAPARFFADAITDDDARGRLLARIDAIEGRG